MDPRTYTRDATKRSQGWRENVVTEYGETNPTSVPATGRIATRDRQPSPLDVRNEANLATENARMARRWTGWQSLRTGETKPISESGRERIGCHGRKSAVDFLRNEAKDGVGKRGETPSRTEGVVGVESPEGPDLDGQGAMVSIRGGRRAEDQVRKRENRRLPRSLALIDGTSRPIAP